MSRSDGEYEVVEHNNNIESLGIDLTKKEDKVVIADFDSLLYFAAYTGKDEEGNKKPEYTEDEYEIAEGVLTDKILEVLSNVEEYFNISHLYIAIKGKNNFRHKLLDTYKSNRPPSLPIINHLANYLIEKYDAVQCDGCESDDLCYSISKTINHEGIILTIDKDFKQIPTILYNYAKNTWQRVSEEDAKYHFAIQMLMGDSGDCIPGIKGIGPKKAEKIVQKGMTDYQYLKAIFKAYTACYKEEAKEKMMLMYNLLKLHDIDDLPIKKEI